MDYARQLAEALAQQQSAESGLGMADRLSQAQYAPNSGALGSLAMVAQAYAGKKIRGRESKSQAEAMEKVFGAKAGMESDAELRKAENAEKLTARVRTQRENDARKYGLSNAEAREYILTGKLSGPVRGVPMMTNQGLVNVNPYTGEAMPVGGGQQPELPPNVRLDPNLSPEERAAAMADIAAGAPEGDQEYRVNKPQGSVPLMPYEKPPSALDVERINLARRTADRADSAEARAQESARRAAELADRKANQPNAALEQWVEARKGLEDGLGRTDTGPIVGRLPALTTDQQIAEGSVAATAPILKQLFRTAGEGTFTDKDQELLMKMVPTRTDTPEARKAKIENIDRIIRAKLGGSRPAASDNIDDLVNKYRGK